MSNKQRKQFNLYKKRERLYNQVEKSTDPGLKEIFDYIENEMFGYVQEVNIKVFDTFINNSRELDLVCPDCIIEVKGFGAKRALRQLLDQKRYAASQGKKHILYAPNIAFKRKEAYEKEGITIYNNKKDLVNKLKEYRDEKLHINNKNNT